MMGYFSKAADYLKNEANKAVMAVSTKLSPPPEKDMFQINGELCPNEFVRAGDKLTEVCTGWKWKPSANPNYSSKYLDNKDKQYLVLEQVICKKRLADIAVGGEQKIVQEGNEEIIILNAPEESKEEEKEQNFRTYTMYIEYDEYYHTPRMYFSATDYQGKPISNEAIRQDIQKQYLDKTLTVEAFKFMENTYLPTVHPCKHAAVLKTMADSMVEGGQKVQSHFALLIFLKFITSVIPTVEFDMTGDLIFK